VLKLKQEGKKVLKRWCAAISAWQRGQTAIKTESMVMDENKQVAEKNKPAAEDLMIPKHRFDCVNLCLKETKEVLGAKTAEVDAGKLKIAELEKALLEAQVKVIAAVQDAFRNP